MHKEIVEKHIENRRILASTDFRNPEFIVLLESIQLFIDSCCDTLKFNPLRYLREEFPQFDWKHKTFSKDVQDCAIVNIAGTADRAWLKDVTGSWRDGIIIATYNGHRKEGIPFVFSGPKEPKTIWGLLNDQPWANSCNPKVVELE